MQGRQVAVSLEIVIFSFTGHYRLSLTFVDRPVGAFFPDEEIAR